MQVHVAFHKYTAYMIFFTEKHSQNNQIFFFNKWLPQILEYHYPTFGTTCYQLKLDGHEQTLS